MEANYSQRQKSLTLKMSAKSEANIDRFCELTQSWLPMEKTEKDPGQWCMDSKELREMIKSWWAEKIHIGKTDRCGIGGSLARRFLLACGDKTDRYLH